MRMIVLRIGRFGLVGVAGFLVDAGVVAAMLQTLGPLGARLLSFPAAVAVTFLLNSRFTFADRQSLLPQHVELGRYFASMIVGGAINWCVYAAIMALLPEMDRSRVMAVGAVAAGSLAGMGANLLLAQRFVFRSL